LHIIERTDHLARKEENLRKSFPRRSNTCDIGEVTRKNALVTAQLAMLQSNRLKAYHHCRKWMPDSTHMAHVLYTCLLQHDVNDAAIMQNSFKAVMMRHSMFDVLMRHVEHLPHIIISFQLMILCILAFYVIMQPGLRWLLQSPRCASQTSTKCRILHPRNSPTLNKRCCCSTYCCKGCSSTRSAPYG